MSPSLARSVFALARRGFAPVDPTTVEPETGLASDYLNHFNQIIMMLEQLPGIPDLRADILDWRPLSYRDFIRASQSDKAAKALRAYELLDPILRRAFDAVVAGLDKLATDAIRLVGERPPGSYLGPPELAETTRFMRILLDRAAALANHEDAYAVENAQKRADRLLGR
ncbi:MAG: hypothetical protein JO366_22420 [Methylobacteriaceae bacterium]|nr:hypothetical protein [Methylobacteriaceae bacterium]MBV9218707.1 hypothetical protein [Methylobacteriaceae bacterium]MBV9247561.1 hypothetical protein [Methylobacteriaceae bacterium]MBV9634984.1 hypothetical protein [Methylobacteriaceae bacterium]MBV9703163.1 hypothetical protein [Methylobacteriaceae bacterium]